MLFWTVSCGLSDTAQSQIVSTNLQVRVRPIPSRYHGCPEIAMAEPSDLTHRSSSLRKTFTIGGPNKYYGNRAKSLLHYSPLCLSIVRPLFDLRDLTNCSYIPNGFNSPRPCLKCASCARPLAVCWAVCSCTLGLVLDNSGLVLFSSGTSYY